AHHPLDEPPVPGRQVVERAYGLAARYQRGHQVRADETGGAGDEVPGATQSAESLAATDVFHHPGVLDFPHARALLDVLQLASHFPVDFFVDRHVALQDGGHLAPQLDVFGEDLVDVGRVHQDLEYLIEQVVDAFVADFDAHLLGGEFFHPGELGA